MHRAQRVLQLVDLAEAGFGVVALADDVALHALRTLAHELVARTVDPREHHVDLEVDVGRERREHVLERRPVASVQVHDIIDRLGSRQCAPHQRVLDRRLDHVVAEPPELELHGGRASVAQAADGFDARPVDAQDGGLAARRESPVGEEDGVGVGGALGGQGRGVERLVRECVAEGACNALALGAVDGDERALIVAAHEEERDAGVVERVADREQVFDHRRLRGHVPVAQRVLPLAHHQVVAIESRRTIRGCHEHEFGSLTEPHRRGGQGLGPRERMPVRVQVRGSIAVAARHGVVASRASVWWCRAGSSHCTEARLRSGCAHRCDDEAGYADRRAGCCVMLHGVTLNRIASRRALSRGIHCSMPKSA